MTNAQRTEKARTAAAFRGDRIFQAAVSLLVSPLVVLLLLWQLLRLALGLQRRPRGEVVFSYSQVMWDEVWQRPQEFAWRLSAGHPVVFVAPVQVHRWLFTLGRRWKPVQVFREGRDLVVLSPLVFSGHYKSGPVFALNSLLLAALGRAWLRDATVVRAVVNTPFADQVVDAMFFLGGERDRRLGRMMFDFIDDFAAFEWAPPGGRRMEQRLLGRSDVVITGTNELLEQVRPAAPGAEFIPCGVDFELFGTEAPEPADLAPLPRPIIGYFGSISERIDTVLISRLADEFPGATLLMVGPVHLDAESTPRAPNIHYTGLRPHDALPGYARRFAVGLIPFRITPATLKLNPVKTLEYLAAGVPVVSTEIPDVVRFFGGVVRIAEDHDRFVAHVRETLSVVDEARRDRGVAMARGASWQAMADRMEAALWGGAKEGQA